jgi:hypothetical protein
MERIISGRGGGGRGRARTVAIALGQTSALTFDLDFDDAELRKAQVIEMCFIVSGTRNSCGSVDNHG